MEKLEEELRKLKLSLENQEINQEKALSEKLDNSVENEGTYDYAKNSFGN